MHTLAKIFLVTASTAAILINFIPAADARLASNRLASNRLAGNAVSDKAKFDTSSMTVSKVNFLTGRYLTFAKSAARMRLAFLPYIVLAGLLIPRAVQGESAPRIRAIGTEIQIILPSGKVLAGKQLVGSVLSVQGPNGSDQLIRIDDIKSDPTDPDGDIQLHSLSVQDPDNQSWGNFLSPVRTVTPRHFP